LIASEGFFSLIGHNGQTDKQFDAARCAYSPFQFNPWYTAILEAQYGEDRVTLDVTIKHREEGTIVGRYHYVDTEVLLKGGAAGMHIHDPVGVKFQLDNCELQLID